MLERAALRLPSIIEDSLVRKFKQWSWDRVLGQHCKSFNGRPVCSDTVAGGHSCREYELPNAELLAAITLFLNCTKT